MNQLAEKFSEYFQLTPVAGAAAPGRLEVLGNHTDYNEGFVLSCAVGQNTAIVLSPLPGTQCRVMDFRENREMTFDLADMDAPPPRNGSAYIIGMMKCGEILPISLKKSL